MLDRMDPERLLPGGPSLMMILAGGLYLGPFLAGLSQQPRWTIAACAAVMVLWSLLYRSASWPERISDLAQARVVAIVMLLVCVMLVLSSLFFLAGLGLSRIGAAVSLPFTVPLGIPTVSLLVALFVQSPRKSDEINTFIEDALRQLKGFPASPPNSIVGATAKAATARLEGLRKSATVAEVRAAIGKAGVDNAALLAEIAKMGVPPPRPALLAAILIVTDPTGAPHLQGRGEAAWVFDALHGDPKLEVLFARRAITLLAQAPHLWRDMPYSHDVNEADVSSSDPEAASVLRDLRDRLNELSSMEESPDD